MSRHSPFRRFVSLLMAVLVLAASVGLTVQRQTCRMSGRSKVEISVLSQVTLVGCQGLQAPSLAGADDECCDFSSHLHKVATPVHKLAAKVPVPAPLLLAWVPKQVWPGQALVVAHADVEPRWFAADASPPPPGGRGLLALVCTLMV
ncbi:hypothetical protein ACFQT0_19160 [Hymenobacter humi]|uniref:Uncharacterized protein n=1 Tax=Hymenobacter humi TaxID=1411620 RepID=A0ABW2U821_9BACT